MARQTEAHPELNQEEYGIAAVGGVGVTALILAAFFMVSGIEASDQLIDILTYGGLGALAVSFIAWLGVLRPWENFDDLQTPYYTGHHHDDHDTHDDGHLEMIAAEAPQTPMLIVEETAAGEPVIAEVVMVDKEDELKVLEGIGPKSEAALKAEGIRTFDQVARLTEDELRAIMERQNVRLVASPASWIPQAALAAAGLFTQLEDLKIQIKNGVAFDDLTRLEGVGLQIQALLYRHQIRTFADIAKADPGILKGYLEAEKITANPNSWPRQAQYIVDGDLSGLRAYQDQLKGGRE